VKTWQDISMEVFGFDHSVFSAKDVFHGKFPTSSTASQTSGVLLGGVCVWNNC